MKPVHECWAAAQAELLGQGASPDEVMATRRTFFVGALCLWQLQNGFADLPQGEQQQLQESLRQELLMFRATVGTPLEGKL